MEHLARVIKELLECPPNTDWVEFAAGSVEPDELGAQISALSNAAALWGRENAYMVWGMDPITREFVGTDTCRRAERASLEKELRGRMMLEMELYFYRVWIEGKRIVVLAIPAADQEPSAYDGKAYVQVNGERRDMDASPELKSRLMDTLVSGIPSMGDWKFYSQRLALWKMRLRLAEKGIELDKEMVKRGLKFQEECSFFQKEDGQGQS